jgi:hypothetical protein
MLKMSASFVLAALKGSAYGKEYASPFPLLRPRWTAILNILRGRLLSFRTVELLRFEALRREFVPAH